MANLEKDIYPNAPIIEVAWEIRFTKQTNLNVNEVKDKIINQFENTFEINNLHQAGFNLQFLPSPKAEMIDNQSIGYELKDRSGENIIQIRSNQITLITRVHTNFSNFRERIINVLQIFANLDTKNLFKKLRRIGLRYINLCKLPDDDKDKILRYINLPLNTQDYQVENLTNFKLELTAQQNDLNIKTRFESVMVEDLPKVIIDLDAFALLQYREEEENEKETKEEDEDIIDQILRYTNELHKLIKTQFENSITNEFIKEVME